MRYSPKRFYKNIKIISEKVVEIADSTTSYRECNPFSDNIIPLEDIITKVVKDIPFNIKEFSRYTKKYSFERADTL